MTKANMVKCEYCGKMVAAEDLFQGTQACANCFLTDPRALEDYNVPTEPKAISIDNGNTFVTPEEAIEGMRWEVIAHYMEDDAREQVHYELAPCTNLEFLTRYLKVAKNDLIIG